MGKLGLKQPLCRTAVSTYKMARKYKRTLLVDDGGRAMTLNVQRELTGGGCGASKVCLRMCSEVLVTIVLGAAPSGEEERDEGPRQYGPSQPSAHVIACLAVKKKSLGNATAPTGKRQEKNDESSLRMYSCFRGKLELNRVT